MQLKIYGILNCDTTKKALAWLNKNNIAFSFHDYKVEGISKTKLGEWIKVAGLETIINKRSTTWRELSVAEQNNALEKSGAIDLMMKHNSIIKRPIIENGKKLIVGFNENNYLDLKV